MSSKFSLEEIKKAIPIVINSKTKRDCEITKVNKNRIISYLKDGEIVAAYAGCDYDVFNGKYIPIEFLMQTDGKFRWNTTLVYYVENYNIKLPENFMSKILQENS